MPRQSKQSQIDELERTLKIEQDGLHAEKAKLIRIQTEGSKEYQKLLAERNHYREAYYMVEKLLKIVENLSTRKP